MKTWMTLFLALQPCLLLAGGITIGNGGDVSNSKTITIRETETLINSSTNVLKSIFNALDIEASDSNYNPQNPEYYKKLFLKNGQLINALAKVVIDIKNNDSCFDNDNTPKDGSASPESLRICMSSFRIQTKVNEYDAYVKITGLVAHEVSHLAGTTEEEADNFQLRVEGILKNISYEQWKKFDWLAQGRIDLLNFLYYSLNFEVQDKDWKTACKTITSAEEQLQELLPKISSLSLYNSKNYSEISAKAIRNKLAQIYICQKASVEMDEFELAVVELLFEGKKEVLLSEVTNEQIVLFGIIYDIPRSAIRISTITTDEELTKVLSLLAM